MLEFDNNLLTCCKTMFAQLVSKCRFKLTKMQQLAMVESSRSIKVFIVKNNLYDDK